MQCHDLKSPKGSRRPRKIVGRGRGSGVGRTSGKGNKGQHSRSGRAVILNYQGGQMPLIRRISKVGFNSHRPVFNQIVTLDSLNVLNNGTVVNKETLKTAGLINSINRPFKILGGGELKKSLVFDHVSISESAQKAVLAAGGEIKSSKKRIFIKREIKIVPKAVKKEVDSEQAQEAKQETKKEVKKEIKNKENKSEKK